MVDGNEKYSFVIGRGNGKLKSQTEMAKRKLAKDKNAIIIYIKSYLTGAKYPICSSCSKPVSTVRFTPTLFEFTELREANYCPYCGSKFIKRGRK